MVAFPYYDADALNALNAQATVILDLFAARGYVREEPSILQPADIFLFLEMRAGKVRPASTASRQMGMVRSGLSARSRPDGSVRVKVRRRISSPERSRKISAGCSTDGSSQT